MQKCRYSHVQQEGCGTPTCSRRDADTHVDVDRRDTHGYNGMQDTHGYNGMRDTHVMNDQRDTHVMNDQRGHPRL